MAIHDTPIDLLKAALPEYITAARLALENPKPSGGVLGHPSATLLFGVAEIIGSFHKGSQNVGVIIDGAKRSIVNKSQHLFIFNSRYYGLKLTGAHLKKLYDNYRSLLTHNGIMAPNHFLIFDPSGTIPFFHSKKVPQIEFNHEVPVVNLAPFYEMSAKACDMFLADADRILPGSRQLEDIMRRA